MITILFFVVLAVLFAKACIETVIGLAQIAYGVVLYTLGTLICWGEWIIRQIRSLTRQTRKPALICGIICGLGTVAAAEPAAAAKTFPLDYTITDIQSRKMEVTLTGKTENGVLVTRKSDGKSFEIALVKLSEDDRKFVEKLKNPEVIKFDGHIANYGYYTLIRIKNTIYAVRAQGIPSAEPRPNDPCVYAIKYTISEISDAGISRVIAEQESDEQRDKNERRGKYPSIKCRAFDYEWSACGSTTCYYYYSDRTIKALNGVPVQGAPKRADGLPAGAEYYNQQLPSLDAIKSLDPAGWMPVSEIKIKK